MDKGMRQYQVLPGDSLPAISARFFGSPAYADYIFQCNSHYIQNPNQLAPGQVITIPHLTFDMATDHVLRRLQI